MNVLPSLASLATAYISATKILPLWNPDCLHSTPHQFVDEMKRKPNLTDHRDEPNITLVGVGVVGKAILQAHVDAGVSVCLIDQDSCALTAAATSLGLPDSQWDIGETHDHPCGLPCLSLIRRDQLPLQDTAPLLIESIPERLELKRSFFSQIQEAVDPRTVLCSNTSTLRICDLAEGLRWPHRFCGMHFFMPVHARDAAELIQGELTDAKTLSRATKHLEALGKTPLIVRDSPGFVVNRLLSPYLNEALMLLCQGVQAKDIESAAIEYGMPISPLELIDTIGARTMFDAGRVYWQAFPNRIDPSPLLAGLVKSKRMGKHLGAGLFAYEKNGKRSDELAEESLALVDRYRRDDDIKLSQADLIDRLAGMFAPLARKPWTLYLLELPHFTNTKPRLSAVTKCKPRRPSLKRLRRQAVEVDFDGGTLTSDGGLLLLREVDKRLDLIRRISECIPDPRSPAAYRPSSERAPHQPYLRYRCRIRGRQRSRPTSTRPCVSSRRWQNSRGV